MPSQGTGQPLVSVVAPMYNEAGNVEPFVAAVAEVLEKTGASYEILLVDDGSEDGTWDRIKEQVARRSSVRGLSLSRNFGHQSALLAGMQHASGRSTITMDGDLQHPPEVIPQLLSAWGQGHKVVTTTREDGPDTGWFKRLSSHLFYRIFSQLTGVPLSSGSSDYRLLDAEVVKQVLEMRDQDLFLRGMISWLGFSSVAIPFRSQRRHTGRTKYSLGRMLRFSFGALTGFSMAPLRAGIWLGFFTSALASAEIVYILVQYARGNTVPGWASVMTVMSFMFGVMFVLLGAIGVYLGKVFEILKGRKRFVVSCQAGFATGAPAHALDAHPDQTRKVEDPP